MADNETTIISDLPQITLDELTNDTLVPVENVDGTKAANLGQLRKKLNSLYVEMVDADLNELKQDGIYECWGTTLNAPTSDVGAWIVQAATHESVTVQNAFGLGTTSYSYVYRRRWDGVSWTAWENRILANETSIAQKANASNTVTTNTNQTITAGKTFTNTAKVVLLNDAARKLTFKSTVYDVNAPGDDQYYGILDFRDKNDNQVGRVDILNKTTTEIRARIGCENAAGHWSFLEAKWLNGVPLATAPTPPITEVGSGITTAKWVRDLLKTSGQAYTWSKKQNGYINFSNGFIVQWGYVSTPLVSNSRGTLTFPIPFKSVLSISGNTRRSSGDAVSFAWFSQVTLTTACWGFDYTGRGGSDGIDWIAVGF